MAAETDGPELSDWFWDLLESSGSSLRNLCRKLEKLPKKELIVYRRQYNEAKDFVNPCYCEEYAPYLINRGCSEDHGDDFSAWVVMRGRQFYEQVRSDPTAIETHLDAYDDVERKIDDAPRWDESVDRDEYRGHQRADYIATPIYQLRFGGDLEDELDQEKPQGGRS